ncbi:HlyD family type I secretion periplasmic adaptor subunit [Mesorhizobium sp. VK25A]|uniref:Membrane fusion protein (MFP) family protein n=1 Tax=Mesorhizobium vachelliae TaxID=3072309 RepID=A0ABU5A5I0_9HYPH|nr:MULTISPECIES: HlyD family type I secretion periplasmic adaptor subunit [unclassified Mesorhizobium]MDX8532462.1 HlyD family type I secretion periplasmic adaptor subunit [Mesorhizobium sp. VK25D]MDX8547892.1 HlyD family type I secretion periplasmic adaptor subunit [Mesorhizobium sp. VK25A]
MTTISAPDSSAYRNPWRPALWGAVALLAFVLLVVGWGYVAPLSSAAIAEGSLQVEAQRQSVAHPYGGIISKLLVTEGQHVERGQPLIELDGTESQAKLDIAKAEVMTLVARQARLLCERDDAHSACLEKFRAEARLSQGMEGTVANESAVMLARAHQYEAEKGMLVSKVAQLREKISGLEAQKEGLSKQNALMLEEMEGARKLAASGFTPKTRVLELERAAARILADIGSGTAEIATTTQESGEAELAIAKLERQRINEIVDQIRTTQSSLAEALPKFKAAQDVMNRTLIRSPVSGSIVDLSVFTEGGVVQAGQKLMDIVPSDNPIIVEARLPLADINGINTGAAANIWLTGVPRNERPQLRGEIISVSADKITDSRSGLSYFAIRTSINPDDLNKSTVSLQPGMPAEVVVTNGSRTLIGYLLGPLLDEVGHAFREE